MTTETESLSDVVLWLATKMPALRAGTCPCAPHCTDVETCATCAGGHFAVCARCQGRGWVPNVSLEGLLEALGCEITPGTDGVAEALFVGLATDTGWFQYKSAGAEVMRLAARLIDLGVDKTRLYQLIEETSRPQRLALKARALASLEYLKDGAVAVMTLRPQDFEQTGGTIDDLPNLVNEPMSVGTVRASILLVQREPKRTKISFRSKPSTNIASQGEPIDVNELAQRFGGGGHFHAAGARLETDIDAARAAVIAAIQ